ALLLRDELHGVADGLNVLSRVVRNLDAELFFERHDQLDVVQAVRAQIVDERSLLRHLLRRGFEMLDHDRLNALKNFRHARLAQWYANFLTNCARPLTYGCERPLDHTPPHAQPTFP